MIADGPKGSTGAAYNLIRKTNRLLQIQEKGLDRTDISTVFHHAKHSALYFTRVG